MPQLTLLGSWGRLSSLLATPQARDEQPRRSGPSGRLPCDPEARPKSPILRLPTARRRTRTATSSIASSGRACGPASASSSAKRASDTIRTCRSMCPKPRRRRRRSSSPRRLSPIGSMSCCRRRPDPTLSRPGPTLSRPGPHPQPLHMWYHSRGCGDLPKCIANHFVVGVSEGRMCLARARGSLRAPLTWARRSQCSAAPFLVVVVAAGASQRQESRPLLRALPARLAAGGRPRRFAHHAQPSALRVPTALQHA